MGEGCVTEGAIFRGGTVNGTAVGAETGIDGAGINSGMARGGALGIDTAATGAGLTSTAGVGVVDMALARARLRQALARESAPMGA